jgi:asparagine synthase (glutamine-hydrolysing)
LPLSSRDGTICLTADARIDNREELLDHLDVRAVWTCPRPPFLFGQCSPSSCVPQMGEECVAKLCGDFAFALWDGTKQHLFCARDHMA